MEKTALPNDVVLEDLCLDGLKIFQNKNLYRFTSDPVILANFVRAKKGQTLLDIGTGSGIIPILVCHKTNLERAVGVEIQAPLAELAQKSVEFNGQQQKIQVVCSSIQNFVAEKEFDIVTANPPYKKCGIGQKNQNFSKSVARHEVMVNLLEICTFAKKHLKFGGKFYVCIDAERTAELLFNLKSCTLEPKKMFFSAPSQNSCPQIVFVEAVKGGKEGVVVLPTLITNDKDGKYLETVKKMRY